MNPFSDDKTSLPNEPIQISESQQSTNVNQSAYDGGKGDADYKNRELDLKRREEDLEIRIKQVEEREFKLQIGAEGAATNTQQPSQPIKNQPFKCIGIAYHSISGEIPVENRRTVRIFYTVYLASVLGTFYNLLLSFGIPEVKPRISNIFLAIVYFFATTYIGFFCQYRSIYRAHRDDSTTRQALFFISFSIHILWMIFLALGFMNTGAQGLFFALELYTNKEAGQGTACIVAFCFQILLVIISIQLMREAHNLYRTSGKNRKNALAKEVAVAAMADENNNTTKDDNPFR